MNYTKLKEFLSDSNFIYADVTEKELETVPCAIYFTEFDGVKYIGASIEVEALSEKLMEPTQEEELAEPINIDMLEESVQEEAVQEDVIQP
jgi:hypothetical protein